MDELARAAEVLGSAPEVALACHVNPDADALGSMLGLSAFLRARGSDDDLLVPERAVEAASLGLVPPRVRRPGGGRGLPRRAARHGHVRLRVVRPAGPARRAASNARRRGRSGSTTTVRTTASGTIPLDRPGRVLHVRDGLPA